MSTQKTRNSSFFSSPSHILDRTHREYSRYHPERKHQTIEPVHRSKKQTCASIICTMLDGEEKLSEQHVVEKLLNSEHFNYSSRSSLAQFLATLANSMMFLGVGMMVAVPTNIIGALHNAKEQSLWMNDEETSWFGALMLLIQPVGCIIAGCLQNFIGRKWGMILMNIPEFISWVLLYMATSVNMLYVAAIMMGISAGFMEAPGLAYIGEITEPRIRGMMTSFANINVAVGLLIEFFLGSIVSWRTAVAISAIFPVISIIMISFIPDSPVWLLSKHKRDDALQSLRWLRGWTSEDRVKAEYDKLCLYTEASKYSAATEYISAKGDSLVTKTQTRMNRIFMKVSDFLRGPILKPFALIVCYQFFFHCAALSGVRGYMIEVFTDLDMPAPEWQPFTSSAFMILGGITCIFSVKFVGKRKLSLISMLTSSIGCILLGVYSYFRNEIYSPWIPLTFFSFIYFSSNMGIGPIPWMLISEVFPVRGRALGTAISAAMFYIIASLFAKTYLNLQHIIGMSGCIVLYGTGGLLGFIFLYVFLPETEGKTLAQIEDYFSKQKTNRPIFSNL